MAQFILIGGNGFIGKSLQKQLKGHSVTIIGRSPGIFNTGPYPYFSVAEHTRSEIAAQLNAENAIIIDLSFTAVSNARVTDIPQYFSDNLKLIIENLELAKMLRIHRYIYVSSGGTVYGKPAQDRIDEFHGTDPISNYGIVKLASEKYVQKFCGENEIGYTIVRPANVYGPGQLPFRGQGIIATAIGSMLKGSPFTIFGNGDNVRDYIYIDDFCALLLALPQKENISGIFNAGSGTGNSIVDIVGIIQRLMKDSGLQLNLQYQADRSSDVKINILDPSKINAATGVTASTSLEQGIGLSIEWIKNNLPVKGAARE